METGAIAEFAVRGETGIDLFRRIEEPEKRRSRFECIATLPMADDESLRLDDAKTVFHVRPNDRWRAAMRTALERLRAHEALMQPLRLGDLRSFPTGGGAGRVDSFLYLDFLRAWLVADMTIARTESAVAAGEAPDLATLSTVLRLLLDFNRLGRGRALCDAVLPGLIAQVTPKAARADRHANLAYALRLAGDLLLRAGEAARALEAHEAAVMMGENRFRRRRAIEAAVAAGDAVALQRHLALFARRWPLPEGLARLRASAAHKADAPGTDAPQPPAPQTRAGDPA